jgi:hypothetical protein
VASAWLALTHCCYCSRTAIADDRVAAEIVFLTHDERLARAARASGLSVQGIG